MAMEPAAARRLWRTAGHLRPEATGVEVVRPPPDNVSNVPWVPDAPPLTETGSITAAEYAAGVIEPAKLQFLAEFFQREGYAIVGGLFPLELLDRIEPRLDEDAGHQVAARILQDRVDGGSAAQGMRHLGNGLPRQAIAVDLSLHDRLSGWLDSALMTQLYADNRSRIAIIQNVRPFLPDRIVPAMEEHLRIIAALEAGDIGRATEAIRQHLHQTMRWWGVEP